MVADAYNRVSKEYPNTKRVTVSPSSSSLLTRIFTPRGANAVTNPFTGNITYNPATMAGYTQQDVDQIIAHELKHVQQTQNTPWWKIVGEMFSPDEKVPEGVTGPTATPYYWRPREMEAYQEERDRASRLKLPYYSDPTTGARDIYLPPEKPINPNQGRMGSPLFTGPSPEVLKKMRGGK